ncbi:MAG: methyl-accepting chemotaxis protein [Pseudomonadota bacterium]
MNRESVTFKPSRNLSDLSIRAKMILCAFIPMAAVVLVACLGLNGLSRIVAASEELHALAQEAGGRQVQSGNSGKTPDPVPAAVAGLKTSIDKIREIETSIRILLLVGAPGIIVITMGTLFILAGTIRKPFLQAESVIAMAKQGDLSERLEIASSNEVGRFARALNDMLESVRAQIAQVLEGVRVLTEASTEIASTGTQLASSTSNVSSAVSETSAVVEQVRQSARMGGDKAKNVAESAAQMIRIADSGTSAAEDTVDRMNVIKGQIESIHETVVKLSDHSRAIEEIIGAVQDLANQSNLLAVNASIEAARAGDQGKGFSVVAQEIKTLADQSKEATGQIRHILEDTQKWVNAVVTATRQGSEAVDAGVEQSVVAGEAIRALSESVAVSSQAAGVIYAQTEQQLIGVHQVSDAMKSIEEVMRQNLDAASQLEQASNKLRGLQTSLSELVGRYQV